MWHLVWALKPDMAIYNGCLQEKYIKNGGKEKEKVWKKKVIGIKSDRRREQCFLI